MALTKNKLKKLKESLAGYEKTIIAFSGGKDSFFLARVAVEVLKKEMVMPFFISTPLTPRYGHRRIAYFQRLLDIPIGMLQLNLLENSRIKNNRHDRCYQCKRLMFSALHEQAKKLGTACIIDGSTASDESQYRPGRRALIEKGIVSPLQMAGITSAEIAAFLKKSGIKQEFLHSTTCLATRFPYDHPLKLEEFEKIARVEDYLQKKKFSPVRVRYMEQGVRIETTPDNFPQLLVRRASLLKLCRTLGLTFVTLDLAGFRSGSWDQIDK